MKIFSEILGYLGIGSACLPISILLYMYAKGIGKLQDRLFYLLSIEYFLINLLTLLVYLSKMYSYQEYFFGFHYFFENLLLMFLLFNYSVSRRKIFIISLSYLFSFIYCFLLYYQNVFEFNKYIAIISNISLVIMSTNYIILNFNENNSSKIFKDGIMIIILGVLFFNAIQVYFSLFETFIRDKDGVIFFYLWPIFQISGIIYYIIFSIGLWKLRRL